MLLRRVVELIVICSAVAQGQRNAQTLAASTVMGTVTDSSGAPLMGAEVRLIVAGATLNEARTGDDGRFFVSGEVTGKGRSTLQVRRVGFSSREVELVFPRDTMGVLIIVMNRSAARLAGVDVAADAEDASGWLREFYQRRKSHNLGIYFTRQEMISKQPRYVSDVLRGVPGITLSSSRRDGLLVRMRNCKYAPVVWLNGFRMAQTELDDVARLDDIAAMEVYLTNAGVPPEFLDRSNLGCGTILVWTRES